MHVCNGIMECGEAWHLYFTHLNLPSFFFSIYNWWPNSDFLFFVFFFYCIFCMSISIKELIVIPKTVVTFTRFTRTL